MRYRKPVVHPLGQATELPLEVRRKLYLAMSGEIAKQLDTQGVADEQIEREFSEQKKRRRR